MLLCIPRCPTCGYVIDPVFRRYTDLIREGNTPKEILNSDEFKELEYCCKMVVQTTNEVIDTLLEYPGN